MIEKSKILFYKLISTIRNNKVFILALIISAILIRLFARTALVNGESMYPALKDGDILVLERVSYMFKNPDRFDIVSFKSGDEDEPYYVKRVIGLPGEKIRISEKGEVYINGEVLEENFWGGPLDDPGDAETEITLEDDEIFVLGDNCLESLDSRYIGPVKLRDIVGHVYFRLLPFKSFGSL